MKDAARQPVPHRDAGRLELIVLRVARLVRGAAARVHQQADLDAAVVRLDELVGVARVGHHPEAHVDLDRLLLDVGEDVLAAVLECGIAEALLRRERLS